MTFMLLDPGSEKVIAPIVRLRKGSDQLVQPSTILLSLDQMSDFFLRYMEAQLQLFTYFWVYMCVWNVRCWSLPFCLGTNRRKLSFFSLKSHITFGVLRDDNNNIWCYYPGYPMIQNFTRRWQVYWLSQMVSTMTYKVTILNQHLCFLFFLH